MRLLVATTSMFNEVQWRHPNGFRLVHQGHQGQHLAAMPFH